MNMNVLTKAVTTYVLTLLCCTICAQYPKDDIAQNIKRSASNIMAYPGPQQHRLSPAPTGKRPFYISHFGRCGSHHLTHKEIYDRPWHVLAAADSAGKLTHKGLDVKRRVDLLRSNALGRHGELTPLAAQQQQLIMERLAERFPEVFEGKTHVDARSNASSRCILTMEHALLQLTRMNPRIRLHHNATKRDGYYLGHEGHYHREPQMSPDAQAAYDKFCRRHEKYATLMRKLFNDKDYVRQHVDARQLGHDLFVLAGQVQNTELRQQLTLYDLFSDSELYHYWAKENAWWYINYGGCTLSDGHQPRSQHALLRKIISDADSLLKLPAPGIQLRFGHETSILPLACLMDINHWGLATNRLKALDKKGWATYRIIPTSANMQLVFYRSNPDDQDVWVKVLYNEEEATLPLPADQAPYYRWSDFRTYYLNKLDGYEED